MFGLSKLFQKEEDPLEAEDNSLINEINEASAQRQQHEAQLAQEAEKYRLKNLREEYELCKERIYALLNKSIQTREFAEAQSTIDPFYEVAKDDKVFIGLYDQFLRQQERELNIESLNHQLASLPPDDCCGKINIYDKLLQLDPYNETYRNGKLSVLKTQYELALDSKQKLQICNDILTLDPDNKEFAKKFKKCQKECQKNNERLSERRQSMASIDSVPQPSSQIEQQRHSDHYPIAQYEPETVEIGRPIWFTALDTVYYSENCNVLVRGDKTTLNVHTHGISINGPHGAYLIHHKQIVSIEVKKQSGGLLKTVAGAVVGGLVGGVVGALVGGGVGAAASGSSIRLCISYRPSAYDSVEVLQFGIDEKSEDKAEAKFNAFIQNYYKEIRITLSRGRVPQPYRPRDGSVSRKLIFVFVLVILAIATACFVSLYREFLPKTSPVTPQTIAEIEPVVPVEITEPPKPAPVVAVDSEEWEAISATRCSFNMSGTTLIVTGSSPANAVIELSGLDAQKCDSASVSFDNKSAKSAKCSIIGNTIQVSSDQRFIKNMRNSNTMTLTISVDETTKREFKYSLKGFSKACSWTK